MQQYSIVQYRLLLSSFKMWSGDGISNDETACDSSSKTNFDAAKSYIESNIIVSMKILQTVYDDTSDDKRYRHKLKQFVQPSSTSPELVFTVVNYNLHIYIIIFFCLDQTLYILVLMITNGLKPIYTGWPTV